MFCDYLDLKSRGSTTTPPILLSPDVLLSSLSEEEKKRAVSKKITEEEAEVFDFAEFCRPFVSVEPSVELKWYNKVDPSAAQRFNSEEESVKLAQRLLQLFAKTEMLESAVFKYDDIRVIRVYFMDDREMPSEKMISILDNIFTVSMTKLGQFSDKISVVVDYELRAFMSDPPKAKRMVLESMLKFPEYIPDSWGGESAIMKWKESKEADVRRREADEKEREKEKEKEKEKELETERNAKEQEENKKKEERKAKEAEENRKKEDRIKKEVEEAERKKKEEKEKRKKEVAAKKKKEKEEEGKKKELKKKTKRAKKASNPDATKTKESKETAEPPLASPNPAQIAAPPPVKKIAKNALKPSREPSIEREPSLAVNRPSAAAPKALQTPGRKTKKGT
ncbi:unnamed protein product [Caenorhabditis sp. 36 PRJEB53466]|nr:unnamed protein product [Caenorhabditis sp. 36 PRJEB53466]